MTAPAIALAGTGVAAPHHVYANLTAASLVQHAMIRREGRLSASGAFMGVTGVHPVAGLSTGDFEEAAIKRALAERAAETVVLASQSKLRAASQFVIGEITLAQTIVVEKETDPALTKPIEAAGVTVVRA